MCSLSLRLFFISTLLFNGIALPNDLSQSSSLSSYLKGAAVFCAGVVCMKGTSYLYQRYWMPKSKSTLDTVRRSMSMQPLTIPNDNASTQRDNSATLANLKSSENLSVAANLLHQSMETADQLIVDFDTQCSDLVRNLNKLQAGITLPVNEGEAPIPLNDSQQKVLQDISGVYRRRVDDRRLALSLVAQSDQKNLEEIGGYYAIFSTQKLNKPNLFRRISSIFGTQTRRRN